MTQKNAHEPDNQNWMDIAESDAVNGARQRRSRLPFVAAAIALVAVGGGALFNLANNPGTSEGVPTSIVTAEATDLPTAALPTAVGPTLGQGVTVVPPVVSIPTIPPVAGGGRYDDDDDEDEDEDDDEDEDEDDYEDEDDD